MKIQLEIKNTEIQHLQSLFEQANLERSEALLAKKRIEERYQDVDSSYNSLI